MILPYKRYWEGSYKSFREGVVAQFESISEISHSVTPKSRVFTSGKRSFQLHNDSRFKKTRYLSVKERVAGGRAALTGLSRQAYRRPCQFSFRLLTGEAVRMKDFTHIG